MIHEDYITKTQPHTRELAAPRSSGEPELPSLYRCYTCKHRVYLDIDSYRLLLGGCGGHGCVKTVVDDGWQH